MRSLPRQARVVWFVTLLGAGFLLLVLNLDRSLADGPPSLLALVCFLVGGTVAELFIVRLPGDGGGQSREISLAMAVNVAMALLFPPAVAGVLAMMAYLPAGLIRRKPWYKVAFNVAQAALSTSVASVVAHLVSPGPLRLDHPLGALAILLALGTYFVLNTGNVSLIIATSQQLPVAYVWSTWHRSLLPSYVGLLIIGVLVVVLWQTSPISVGLVVVLLGAVHWSFRTSSELQEQTVGALVALADLLDERDPGTYRHSRRVEDLVRRTALELGLGVEEVQLVALCGRLHDIGKCAISNEVLRKTGPLTPEEWQEMARHPSIGADMLERFSLFRRGAWYVRHHHERWDGKGYPAGLKGPEIPLGARIIAVADAYDAMTNERPYRPARSHAEAVKVLREGAGAQWDPAVVRAFLDAVGEASLTRVEPAHRPVGLGSP
ncbi:MAG TPA: HD-GYP domain-containing protein [Chloroflexota bacterium]